MRGKIFISYRRDDSAGTVQGIAQYLGRAFGRNQVFLDVDMISGTNFPRELSKRLSECSVLLALIGPQWLNVKDAQGRHRLDDPDDWVRLEIGQALKRGIVVIPVMIGAAQLPDKAALPDDLKGLLDHQAARVSTDSFRNDLAGLAKDISMLRGRTRWPAVAAAVVIAVLIAGAGFGAWQAGWFGRAPSRPQASERPAQRAEPTPPSGPVSTADVLARCVRDQKHPDGADIAADLANKFANRRFRYGWVAETSVPTGAPNVTWHDIVDASAGDGALQLRIPWRNGRLRLVPVVQRRHATRSARVALMLQGMWSQDNGYGCIELTFDNDGQARGAIGVMDASKLDTQAFIERVYERSY